jgi:hypothetical protein
MERRRPECTTLTYPLPRRSINTPTPATVSVQMWGRYSSLSAPPTRDLADGLTKAIGLATLGC